MALQVTRKRTTVDLILDQDAAEQISRLGRQLEAVRQRHATEGTDPEARRLAREIQRLRDKTAPSILHITLEALPLSQWRQILEANTTMKDGQPVQRVEDLCADAIRAMTRNVTPDTPVEEIADVMKDLSDGQISPIWYAIRDLNARLTDPKDYLENASRILHDSSGNSERPAA